MDRFGRKVTTLRISITEKCNLNCIYCHREGTSIYTGVELTPSELSLLVEAAAELGIRKVKLTGGEPLMREDVVEAVEAVAKAPGVVEVSMTTNGTLLAKYASSLARAGLKRVNVNLPSLKPERYRRITGFDLMEEVKRGLFEAAKTGLEPIKINMVVLKGLNVDEIHEMINFAAEVPAILQLIELEKLGYASSKLYDELYYDLTPIENWLENKAVKVVFRSLHNRRKYVLPEGQEVEVIRPFHGRFCMGCSRMRVTANGRLKPCLMREDNTLEVKEALRKGDVEGIKELLRKAVELKEPYCL